MYDNIDPKNCNPPGTFLTQLPHPNKADETIEKAVIMEHRFAFFFWMKWRNMLRDDFSEEPAPTLVTIDWHRDLAPVTEEKKERLQKLDQKNFSDATSFVWGQLDQTNDGHILSAAWLNLVGDVVLLQNTTGYQEQTFEDMNGNEHHILEIRDWDQFQEVMLNRDDQHIFFDIDLDYFIHGKGKRLYSDDFSRYTNEEIKAVIDPELPVFQHLLSKCEGITLAQEPGYCGGMLNSSQIMTVIHKQLFTADGDWRHLKY